MARRAAAKAPSRFEIVNADDPEKRLVRPVQGRFVAGVCQGIARYFAVDVTLVRVLWAVLTLFFCTGLLVYVVCWALIPEEGAPGAPAP
jgi:phage shock protein PspC (stress-responsive transcriptional regulator)